MRIDNLKPKVAILLATFNGLYWLSEQIESILNQKGVEVTVFVSDDLSQDTTYEFLEEFANNQSQIKILPQKVKLGSAGKNFYRLIQDVDIAQFDFIAFADQDDIWESDKLIRHVHLARQHGADGVSSDVMAFWPDGKRKLIIKSQLQQKWDFLFESAGPGCTFLMTPWLVNKVREQLLNENSPAKDVSLHDWLTYAVCRANGGKWVIDSAPSLRYRQHNSNVIGANVGLKAKWARLKKLRQSWYRQEVIKIVQVCNNIAPNSTINDIANLLKDKTFKSQYKLLGYILQARRSLFDRILLATSIILWLF